MNLKRNLSCLSVGHSRRTCTGWHQLAGCLEGRSLGLWTCVRPRRMQPSMQRVVCYAVIAHLKPIASVDWGPRAWFTLISLAVAAVAPGCFRGGIELRPRRFRVHRCEVQEGKVYCAETCVIAKSRAARCTGRDGRLASGGAAVDNVARSAGRLPAPSRPCLAPSRHARAAVCHDAHFNSVGGA